MPILMAGEQRPINPENSPIAGIVQKRIESDLLSVSRPAEAVEAEYYGRSSAAVAPTAAPSNERSRPDHRRLLANGHCTRPALLDCALESVCERCGFFETGPQFVTILKRQRKRADERGQSDRSQLFDGLIDGVAEAQ